MTRPEFMRLYMELDRQVVDLGRSAEEASAAIDAFESRGDIPAPWRDEAAAAARRSLEMRNPRHLADRR